VKSELLAKKSGLAPNFPASPSVALAPGGCLSITRIEISNCLAPSGASILKADPETAPTHVVGQFQFIQENSAGFPDSSICCPSSTDVPANRRPIRGHSVPALRMFTSFLLHKYAFELPFGIFLGFPDRLIIHRITFPGTVRARSLTSASKVQLGLQSKFPPACSNAHPSPILRRSRLRSKHPRA